MRPGSARWSGAGRCSPGTAAGRVHADGQATAIESRCWNPITSCRSRSGVDVRCGRQHDVADAEGAGHEAAAGVRQRDRQAVDGLAEVDLQRVADRVLEGDERLDPAVLGLVDGTLLDRDAGRLELGDRGSSSSRSRTSKAAAASRSRSAGTMAMRTGRSSMRRCSWPSGPSVTCMPSTSSANVRHSSTTVELQAHVAQAVDLHAVCLSDGTSAGVSRRRAGSRW